MELRFEAARARPALADEDIDRAIDARSELIGPVLAGPARDAGMLGWLAVGEAMPEPALAALRDEAARARELADTLVLVGIGGSNRGALAAIGALGRRVASPARVVCAGDSLSASALREVLATARRESVVLDVVAKDFNTLEPGIAFRLLREAMIERHGEACGERILVTGSRGAGQLLELARAQGYRSLEFPASIGGRFSVLSAVGLFPMAFAGLDVGALLEGARDAERALRHASRDSLRENPAVRYAVARNLLAARGFVVEGLAAFEPDLAPFGRWWTQLFAETDGKCGEAVFPTFLAYSEDLHAVGQFVQQGRRCLFETFLGLFHEASELAINPSGKVRDGFEYLDGKPFDLLNRTVREAALEAHSAGGVPCLELSCGELREESLGALFYFFMLSAYLSASLLGVNPFTQDGVEGYKRSMYRRLGKTR